MNGYFSNNNSEEKPVFGQLLPNNRSNKKSESGNTKYVACIKYGDRIEVKEFDNFKKADYNNSKIPSYSLSKVQPAYCL